MSRSKQRFVIIVRDGNGTAVGTSHYEPDSLPAAADFGHALQRQSGCTVMVIDKSIRFGVVFSGIVRIVLHPG